MSFEKVGSPGSVQAFTPRDLHFIKLDLRYSADILHASKFRVKHSSGFDNKYVEFLQGSYFAALHSVGLEIKYSGKVQILYPSAEHSFLLFFE